MATRGARVVRAGAVLAVIALVAVLPRESVVGAPGNPADHGPGEGRQGVEVGRVQLVVNDDESATLSAFLQNPGSADVTLVNVRVESGGRALPVASTPMYLPVLRGVGAWVGDASDAGGFVVPAGVQVGVRATVRFEFSDGAFATESAKAVRRTATHDMIFPTDGTRLGQAKDPS